MSERMISWARNGEDVVLLRAFGADSTGFYVDVAAGDPIRNSATRSLYERGWSGVNVEWRPPLVEALRRERTRDVTVSRRPGVGEDSRDDEGSRRAGDPGPRLRQIVAEQAGGRQVDVLRIGRAGDDESTAAALAELVWSCSRPRCLLLETGPMPLAADALERLDEHGYRQTLWDGRTRFFVRTEDDGELGAALSAPASPVLDAFDPWPNAEHLAVLRGTLQALVAHFLEEDMSARAPGSARATDIPAAAAVLTSVLLRRPDVIDAFGLPPGLSTSKLLRWAAVSGERTDEPFAGDLLPYVEVYRELAGAASASGPASRLMKLVPKAGAVVPSRWRERLGVARSRRRGPT